MTTEEALTFLHILAVFWYVIGLTAIQLSLVRAMQHESVSVKADSIEEASHYEGVLLVPGAIAAVSTGVFLWALDYNLITTPWLLLVEAQYIVTLLLFLPLTGAGLRRARIAALQVAKADSATPEQTAAMSDPVPLTLMGLATILVPIMAALSVFKPF